MISAKKWVIFKRVRITNHDKLFWDGPEDQLSWESSELSSVPVLFWLSVFAKDCFKSWMVVLKANEYWKYRTRKYLDSAVCLKDVQESLSFPHWVKCFVVDRTEDAILFSTRTTASMGYTNPDMQRIILWVNQVEVSSILSQYRHTLVWNYYSAPHRLWKCQYFCCLIICVPWKPVLAVLVNDGVTVIVFICYGVSICVCKHDPPIILVCLNEADDFWESHLSKVGHT